MAKKFRQHSLDFRVEEAPSADALELLLMGGQVKDKIIGTFVFFPTPFGKTEDYFLRRVRPEKDIEGLTVENTGRMALNIRTVDEEEKYEGVVPSPANWMSCCIGCGRPGRLSNPFLRWGEVVLVKCYKKPGSSGDCASVCELRARGTDCSARLRL